MPGFDWNGNGKSDAFDHFMDMKVSSSSTDDSIGIDSDVTIDTDEVSDDIDDHRAAVASSLRSVYDSVSGSMHTTTATGGTQSTSFQDELKKNMRTPETVRQEHSERERSSSMWEAQRTLETIKKQLLNKVQNAEYVKQNGVTSVSCICDINHRYLRKRSYNNGDQLRENQKKSFLFRDPNLIYRTWDEFDIEPKYSSEYHSFISALKQIASKDNISIEPVIYNGKHNEVYAFPCKSEKTFTYMQLGIRATTIIASDPAYSSINIQDNQGSPDKSTTETKTPQSSKNPQDDNTKTILKSILVVGLCLGAFAICLTGEIGKLGMGLLLIGAVVLGCFIIMKK